MLVMKIHTWAHRPPLHGFTTTSDDSELHEPQRETRTDSAGQGDSPTGMTGVVSARICWLSNRLGSPFSSGTRLPHGFEPHLPDLSAQPAKCPTGSDGDGFRDLQFSLWLTIARQTLPDLFWLCFKIIS